MIRPTRNRILFITVVMLLVGITFFVVLSQRTEKHMTKPVVENQSITHTDKHVIETQPVDSHQTSVLSEKMDQKMSKLSPPEAGASDEELQHFIDNLDLYEIPDTSDPSVLEFEKHLESIVAGTDTTSQHPNSEDFTSNLDYYKASLAYYENELSKTDSPEAKRIYGKLITSAKKGIADADAWIAGAEERQKEKRESEAMKSKLIELNAELAVLMNLSASDEDWDFYLEHVSPSIPTQIRDETEITIYDRLLKVSEDLDASKMSSSSSFSEKPKSLAERHEDVAEIKPLMKQFQGWHDELIKDFPDIFTMRDLKSRETFSRELKDENTRQYFRDRQTSLHKAYAGLLDAHLKSIPKDQREEAIASARKSLLQKWDRDFADSVLKQLQRTEK